VLFVERPEDLRLSEGDGDSRMILKLAADSGQQATLRHTTSPEAIARAVLVTRAAARAARAGEQEPIQCSCV
jgi:hypothetical protein